MNLLFIDYELFNYFIFLRNICNFFLFSLYIIYIKFVNKYLFYNIKYILFIY